MKKAILIAILLLAAARPSSAQALTEYGQARNVVIDGDTVVLIQLSPSFVFRKAVDTRRFARLIYNLKRVYPIAKEANATLHAMEAHMETLATKREKQIFVKEMERALKKKYTPVLKKMTLSQGKLLIKLIDRETDQTSYELVKELRGGFRAFFWQSIARLFGANLKDTYDKEGEDGFRIKRTSRPARLQTRSVRDNRPAARVTDRHGPDQHIAGTRIGRNSYF